MKARDYLSPDETAIVLCTGGPLFQVNADGTGTSGNWKIHPKPGIDKVIIYLKSDPRMIYIAQYTDVEPSNEAGRFVIRFQNTRKLGVTGLNRLEFAEGGRNPIRYLSASRKLSY